MDITRWSRYWQEAFNGVVMRMALLAGVGSDGITSRDETEYVKRVACCVFRAVYRRLEWPRNIGDQ